MAMLCVLAARPAFAQTSVAGDWDVTVTSPLGANSLQVALKQDGESVSGVVKSQMGELPFEGGTLVGNDLTFKLTVRIQGLPIEITLAGKVDGATIAGKAQFGGFEGDWTAKRSAGTSTTSTATTSTTTTTTTTTSTKTTTGPGAAGKWNVILKTPAGDVPATATVLDTAGSLSGTFATLMGEVPLTGSVDGHAVKISVTAPTPQGGLTVVLTGDLDGDSIVNGKMDLAGIGQMEWSATRAKP